MNPKYKIGFKTRMSDGRYVASCSCGVSQILKKIYNDVTCEGCGNTTFTWLSGDRALYPYIEILEKSGKGFKAKRTNLSLFHDKDSYSLKIKRNMVQVLKYDLVNNEIRLWKNGVEHKLNKGNYERNQSYVRFFNEIDDKEFLKLISVEETRSFFEMVYNKLSRGQYWTSPNRIYRGLSKSFEFKYMLILSNAGFENVERFNKRGHYGIRADINSNGTNPKDILRIPKFVLKYFKEDNSLGLFELKQVQDALTKVDGNRLRELFEIVKDESTISDLCICLDTLIEIHNKYNYTNLKKLALYLFREIRMNQGITSPQEGATLLLDYINMSTKLGQDYEKYPKSLKKNHDVTALNYKVKESEIKRREFKEKVESEIYKSLEIKDKEYSIISPTEIDDLIREGNELSHCVASYVDSIINDRCNIYFMRNTKNLTIPLATIEVRGGNVRQARGYANRHLTEQEREFVSKWADKKKLALNYYY